MNEILTWLLDTVQSVDPVLRTALAGLAIMLQTSILIGLFVPGDTVVIITGTAVGSPLEGVILGIVVVIGALIGESIGFWLGRYLGPKIRHSRLGRRIGEENWERSERYLRRRGGPAIFVSRFLPVGPNADPFVFAIFANFLLLIGSVYAGIADRALELAVAAAHKRTSLKNGGAPYAADPDIR